MNLILYDKAVAALAAVKGVDEAKQILDTAEAMRAYARQAKNRELEVDAAEIRIRAERRVGELIAAQKALPRAQGGGLSRGGGEKGIGRAGKNAGQDVTRIITLTELGIDKALANRARRLAAVDAESFEMQVGEWRARLQSETDRVTTNLLREGARLARRVRAAEPAIHGCTVDDLTSLIGAGRRYGTIYADPPWPYENQRTRGATDDHYATMPLVDIAALPVSDLAAPDAHLHLWTTNAFLREAMAILEAWGFEYKSVFVWVKTEMGMGNYWRVSHEFMLLGIRGDAPFRDHSQLSWMEESRIGHSRKPEAVRQKVEAVSPGPYLELFGRRQAPGWTVWGNKIERTMFDEDFKVPR